MFPQSTAGELQSPVGRVVDVVTYRLGGYLAIVNSAVDCVMLSPGNLDHTIDDGMGDVHTLGLILAGDRLSQSALCPLARSEGAEFGRALD